MRGFIMCLYNYVQYHTFLLFISFKLDSIWLIEPPLLHVKMYISTLKTTSENFVWICLLVLEKMFLMYQKMSFSENEKTKITTTYVKVFQYFNEFRLHIVCYHYIGLLLSSFEVFLLYFSNYIVSNLKRPLEELRH